MAVNHAPDGSGSGTGDAGVHHGRLRVFIVDDHPVVRQGLNLLLRMQPDMECCGEADTVPEALRGIAGTLPDVAMVDLTLRDSSGLELVKTLHCTYPSMPVLVLSMHDEMLYAERVLKAGAMGYVMKDEAHETIPLAVRKVAAGRIHLSERMSGRLLSMFLQGSSAPGNSEVRCLSDREMEVFELIGRGVSTREIAGQLNLSIKTVEAHREHIKKKLRLADANELLHHAIHFVQSEEPV